MTADHGRHALPWYDRRQPAVLTAAARRHGLRTTPRLGQWLDILDGAAPVAHARFSTKGQLARAYGFTVTGKRVDFYVAGFGTPREVLDLITEWLDLGRPDEPATTPTNPVTTTPEREHLAEVLPFRPRKHS